MVLSWKHLLFVLILALPLVGAVLALFLGRFLRDRVVVLIAALPFFLAGVIAIVLVQIILPSEDLGQALPGPETPQQALRQAPTSRWVQPPRTLAITETLALEKTPTPTVVPTPSPTTDPRSQITVAVRNGTGASGLATQTANKLEDEGFRIVEIEDDRLVGERPHSLILDKGDHPEACQMLADILNVAPEYIEHNSDEPGEADIIVILGDDYED